VRADPRVTTAYLGAEVGASSGGAVGA
jgi:hypothetical protein